MRDKTYLNDLRRRLAATRDHIVHLREVRDRLVNAETVPGLRQLSKIQSDLRDAEIDAGRLQSLLTTVES